MMEGGLWAWAGPLSSSADPWRDGKGRNMCGLMPMLLDCIALGGPCRRNLYPEFLSCDGRLGLGTRPQREIERCIVAF